MAKIEVNCPTCGAVLRRGSDFTLRAQQGAGTFYIFNCPTCGDEIRRLADERTIEILIAEGAAPPLENVPAEFFEPRAGAPFTVDDLLDLHELLDQPDWFERFSSKQADSA